MKLKEPIKTLPKLAYVNFFPSPHIVDKELKLKEYRNAFDFLFFLKDYFQITVFDFIGITASFKKEDISFKYFKTSSSSKLRIPLKLFLTLRKQQPEVIYIQGLGYPHFIIIMKWFLKSDTKILVHDHANSIPKKSKFFIFKKADSYVHNYLFTSKQLAEPWLKMGLISSEEKIIECVEGSTQFKFNPEIKKEKNSFLWVGRLDKNKDPLTVLNAFKEYQNHTNAILTMFYTETELLSEVRDFIKTNSLEKNIVLKGAIKNEELEFWYQKSEFFILGSRKEGGPFSLIEAMACGCIPVVTNIPAHFAMTNQGTCGYLFEPGNSDSLLKVLKSINSEKNKEKSSQVLNYFENNLSHKAIATIIKNAVG
ncbi:MAG: glycosyltransferase family 4 protein [Flavobacteriaceae bacterium]|nr:glycosyltransferase family 4 protein [Flavobacteriaceae bacterium]